ncbi:hypothetical protein CVT26_013211 [Gymnopilus dilepis]|uniref:Uncharacterized protein n=1 Tax=Gymnopilus dilepis TaxID=231916 RepID=A0A409WV48_9AGAR|nr:hypothetical protein CVT26_013211 [Gymnopilus dilepis]
MNYVVTINHVGDRLSLATLPLEQRHNEWKARSAELDEVQNRVASMKEKTIALIKTHPDIDGELRLLHDINTAFTCVFTRVRSFILFVLFGILEESHGFKTGILAFPDVVPYVPEHYQG